MTLTLEDAQRFERCIAAGGIVVFPADTVYGLACDPHDRTAIRRLYELKGRPPDKPAAVLYFALEYALGALPELGRRTREALSGLLPGALTVLLEDPRAHSSPAWGASSGTLGLRVPALAPATAALHAVRIPILQSSANRAGEPDARTAEEIDPTLRAAADLVLDAGALPGTPSTVLDLRAYEHSGGWSVLRAGAVTEEALAAALSKPDDASSRPGGR